VITFEDIRKLSDVEIAARLAVLGALHKYGVPMESWKIEESAMLNTEKVNRTWPDYERPDGSVSINGYRREVLTKVKTDLEQLLDMKNYYGEFFLGFKAATAIVNSYLNEELKK
jgi:hypothetical protein